MIQIFGQITTLWFVLVATTEAFHHHSSPRTSSILVHHHTTRRTNFPRPRALPDIKFSTYSTTDTQLRSTFVPFLDEWKVLPDGRIEGKVSNHPAIENGSIISTSPLSVSRGTIALSSSSPYNGQLQQQQQQQQAVGIGTIVETCTGSKYQLLNPAFASTVQGDSSQDDASDETNNLLKQIKDAGLAGAISYALWEAGFWAISITGCIIAYKQFTGHWPDISNSDDVQKLGAEAFVFTNIARFAVPLRIGLALSTAPFVQTNIVDRFNNEEQQQ